MELFSFDFQGHHCALILDFELQLERVLVDGQLMSVKPLGEVANVHCFDDSELGALKLEFSISAAEQSIHYRLLQADTTVTAAVVPLSEEVKHFITTNAQGVEQQARPKQTSLVVLGGIGLKLLKTVKVVKVALAAATVAVYSALFSVEFALALVAVLVFHEYGHVRAMKKFGIPTRGFYLLPFVGGISLGDKPSTQWENLYIAMMGPVFGLLMTAVFYVIFVVTGNHFCGLVTSVSAFVNLINLFPVHPLDGGRVIKALVFSRRNQWALLLLLTLSAGCLFLAWRFGFYFLCFFIVLGVVDLVSGWSLPLSQDLTPLKAYGIWFALLWYLAVTLAFIAMIILVAEAGVPGAEIVTSILKS